MACQGKKKAEAYDWENDLQERLRIDFCRTEAEVRNYIQTYIPDVTLPTKTDKSRQITSTKRKNV